MSPTPRRLLGAAAILIGVLVLVVMALPYLVSLDAMRARVISAAESSLHRKVDIGKIRLQIFSGLGAGIEKLVVHNTPGFETPALVSADRASVKVAFWPLLSRRVEVRRIVLDGVTVAVERGPDGVSSIADFLAASSGDGGSASGTAAVPLVSRIEIDRGRLLFVDRKVSPGKTVTVALEELTGRIHDVSPTKPARFELEARFLADSGRNLELAGTLGPPPAGRPPGESAVKATFAAKQLALARLAPYVAAFRANDPGALSIEATAEGALLGALDLAGNLTLVPAAADSPIPPMDATIAMRLDWPNGTLTIGKSLLSVAKLPLAVEGRIDGMRQTARVDLSLSTPGDVAIDAVTGFPGIAGTLPADVKLSGKLRVEAKVQGPSTDLDKRASVDAAPFGVTVRGQPFFAAPSARATAGSRGEGPLTGRVTAPSGTLKNLPFTDLAADWSWHERALTLVPSARVSGGTLGARVETDMAHPGSESRLALTVEGVQAQPLLESLTSLRNVFSGALHGKMSVASKGLTWQAFSKTARGEGRVAVENADLRTVQLMPEVARALSAVGRVAGFAVPASLESTSFEKLQTSLRLAEGRVSTPDLTLSGRDAAVSADGWLGLDRTLSYQGRIVLGPAIVRSFGNAGKYIADAQGRLALPFRVSGQIAAPKVTIDESLVLDLGRRVLARQAQEKVGGAAGKILGDALDSGDGKSSGAVDLLQQLLKPPPPTPTKRPKH